jgi:acetyl esterase
MLMNPPEPARTNDQQRDTPNPVETSSGPKARYTARVVSLAPLLRLALRSLVALPDSLLVHLLPTGLPRNDRGVELDLHTALLIAGIERAGLNRPERAGPARARAHMDEQGPLVDVAPAPCASEARMIPGPTGPLRTLILRPRDAPSELPILVYFHGGGFVLGSARSHEGVCRLLAHRARCVVVSVEYRLAPEHPFPAAVDDVVAAYQYIREHARSFGGRSDRVALGGDSAGGNLATVTALALRDANLPPPLLQALIYPCTDMRRGHPSHQHFATGFFLDRPKLDWFMASYFGDRHELLVDPRASPLLATRLDGLPPALVLTAGFDPLRDEAFEYVERLRDAAVPVEHRCAERLIHGFWSMGGAIPAARETILDYADLLRVHLHAH